MRSVLRILPLLLIGTVLLLSFAGGLGFVLQRLNLYPPQELSIAAGAPGSAYYDTAKAYQQILARDGISLSIIETNGSGDNANLLAADEGADIALVQGGIVLGEDVRGIASVRLEPLWIFATFPVDGDPNSWEQLRVAAGADGSGTRVVSEKLATFTGASALVDERMMKASSTASASALLNGELDIAMYVAPYQAKYLQPLLAASHLDLVELAHSESIALRIPGARLVRLPSGVLNYQRPLPADDLNVIALVTRLVSREELHPALVNRLVHAVIEVHDGYRVIPADRLYPSTEDLGVEADSYAAQLFEKGFNTLESILPYWIVAQLNRVLLILLPAIFLLLPLMRLIPTLYEVVLKRKVFGHYARVHEIDAQLMRQPQGAIDLATLRRYREQLDAIEQKVLDVNLPNSYRKQAYTLQHHLDFVRQRLDAAIDAATDADSGPASDNT